MAGETWCDFKAIKAQVSIEMVLKRYGLLDGFKLKGDSLTGVCPIHKGTSNRQFVVSLSKKAFNCFSCKAHGNVIDLVAKIEGVEFRNAAILLQEWFQVQPGKKEKTPASQGKEKNRLEEKPEASAAPATPETPAENKPLSFQLKLDPAHPYLASRGLTPETIVHFGLGFSSKGSMKDRIAIPIHNVTGELEVMYGEVQLTIETPKTHGRCPLCA